MKDQNRVQEVIVFLALVALIVLTSGVLSRYCFPPAV